MTESLWAAVFLLTRKVPFRGTHETVSMKRLAQKYDSLKRSDFVFVSFPLLAPPPPQFDLLVSQEGPGTVNVGGGEGREEGWFFLYTKKQKADLNSSVFKNDRKGLLSWERKLGESKQEFQRLCHSVVMPSFSTQQRQKSGSLCDGLWLLPIHCH